MRFVVVGGGIAGICCTEELCRLAAKPTDEVVLVSASSTLKGVDQVVKITRNIEEFKVVERNLNSMDYPNLRIVQDCVSALDVDRQMLSLRSGEDLAYDRLCIATGARPKKLADSRHVLTLRDNSTVEELTRRLAGTRRVMVVGNGGIAMELVGSLTGVDVIWALKHGHVGDAFFDVDAGRFLLEQLRKQHAEPTAAETAAVAPAAATSAAEGAARPPPAQPGTGDSSAGSSDGSSAAVPTSSVEQVPGPLVAGAVASSASGADSSGPAQLLAFGTAAAGKRPAVEHAALPRRMGALQRRRHRRQPNCPCCVRPGVTLFTSHALRGLPDDGEDPDGGTDEEMLEAPLAAASAAAGGASGYGGRYARRSAPLPQPQEASAGPGPSSLAAQSTSGSQGAGTGAGSAGASKQPVAGALGHAPGPRWVDAIAARPGAGSLPANVKLEYNALVEGMEEAGVPGAYSAAAGDGQGDRPWPVTVRLSNGARYGVDLVISAIGVTPNTDFLPPVFECCPEGGLLVDRQLRTSVPNVFAAGDCCTVRREEQSPHWFQMRLWTQARSFGTYAAHCLLGMTDFTASGFAFELFAHVTRFFGLKVVLLGLYNGQKLEKEPKEDITMYTRAQEAGEGDSDGPTFVRVLLRRGRLEGAVLVGETGLEETFENLILDGLDLGSLGPDLLDPEVELDHIFD